jgi:hypothetical protein
MFLPVDYARALANVSRPTIYRWMRQKSIHWIRLNTGHRLICLQSLIEAHEINPRLMKDVFRSQRLLKTLRVQ